MRIGVDIDGVTADSILILIQKLNSETEKNLTLDEITKYSLTEVFECDKKIFQKILNEFDYFHLKPIDGSVEYIKKLSEEGNEIYFLTSRLHIIKNWLYKFEVYFDTYSWLESNFKNKNHKYYKKVVFVSDKAEYAEKHNLDWVIDDDPSVVENCIKRRIPVVLFNCPYNRELEISNGAMVCRVKNWEQIYDIIMEQKLTTHILN